MALLNLSFIGATYLATAVGCGLLAAYALSVIYYLFLSPLRSFPGPISHRISSVHRAYHLLKGDLPFYIAKLHQRYGPVVRIGPNELAFTDPQAWKDIYGHKSAGQEEFPKYWKFYKFFDTMPTSIITSGREEHSMLRRQLSHGFSDRSMRAQEPIIGDYVDLLIDRLRTHSAGGSRALNMREWINWTTFDIIGDLGFGSSFGCLENSNYHPWVSLINDTIRISSLIQALTIIGLRPVVQWISRSGLLKSRDQHRQLVQSKVRQRMELGTERLDLIEGLINKKDGVQLEFRKISMNASALIIAGSETTATVLSGVVFLLTTHPEALARLTEEVRTTFNDDSEITLSSVSDLHYMLACLNESLRHYPPVVTGLPREVPKGGATVAGHFLPGGTVTAVWQWAINHDAACWTDPMEFRPERFMGDPKYKNDQLDAMQPFSTGPRNCIGRNLAYAEMRLILAKIIFNFDMKIADDSRDWLHNQKAYILWDKPSLNVYMTPVAR
ncbi:isotrichodermin C-15 hydroxylase [Xylariales sp. PMI_506]|nr:isotrichodermin C-15 hydroxylase [Xylariales sp. PMI_506]